MLKVLLAKCKEALISVLPVTLIVVILHLTPLITLTDRELVIFLISSLGMHSIFSFQYNSAPSMVLCSAMKFLYI